MENGIRITIVTASVRPENNTRKAAAVVLDEFRRRGVTATLLDPTGMHLPFPGEAARDPEALARFRDTIAGATGIVFATPEYHGSYSSVAKAVIDNMGFPSVFGGKPVALLGVAAGSIGAIKATEHLRSVFSHVGALVLPGPVSVANVRTVFNDDGSVKDPAIEKRIRGLAGTLLDYIGHHICPAVALEAMVREHSN